MLRIARFGPEQRSLLRADKRTGGMEENCGTLRGPNPPRERGPPGRLPTSTIPELSLKR